MTSITYLDFDLQIEHAEQGYRAQIVNSPIGQASQPFVLPFSDTELEKFLVLAGRPRSSVRSGMATDVAVARAFGGSLFEALFSNQLRDGLQGSLNEAERQGKGLRIRLRFNDAPELADIPWEYLYRADADRFLALSANTPLVRYLELPGLIHPLAVTPPLRVLVVFASPRDFPPLDLEAEWNRLHTALQVPESRGLVMLERLDHATVATVQTKLRQGEYHIFHFIGHGGFDAQTQDGMLMLEDPHGNGSRISSRDLGVLLHDSRTLRLVLLNACEGGRSGRKNLFDGVAQNLVRHGIPAVIAMQFPVTDRAAIILANTFYNAVVDNYSVDAALAEARKQLFMASDNLEWGTPVLYLRTPNGQIFDMAATAPPTPITKPVGSSPLSVSRLRPSQIRWLVLAVIALVLVTAGMLISHWLNPAFSPAPGATNTSLTNKATLAAPSATSNHQVAAATATLFPAVSFTFTATSENLPTATVAPTAKPSMLTVTLTPTALTVTPKAQPVATLTIPNEWRKVLLLDRHAGPVNRAIFSPDGKWIVTSGRDNTTRVWSAATGKQVTVFRDTNNKQISEFSPNSSLLVTIGTKVRLWQVGTWQPVDIQGTPFGKAYDLFSFVNDAVFSADGTQLAIVDHSQILVWAVGTWESTVQLQNPAIINAVAFRHDGTAIATALSDSTVRVWDLKSDDTLSVLRGHTSEISDVAFSPDGQLIVTAGSRDQTARIWDVATEQTLLVLNGHTSTVFTAVFSPDGKQILTASADRTAQLWDANTGVNLAILRSQGMLLSARFNSDGTRIITSGEDGTVSIWSKAAGNP